MSSFWCVSYIDLSTRKIVYSRYSSQHMSPTASELSILFRWRVPRSTSKVGGRITQDEGRMICVSSSTMRDSYKSSTASANEKSTDLNEPIEGGRGSESMGWAEMVHRLSQQKSEEAVGRDRSNSATMADGGTADTLEMSGRSDRYDSATRSHAVLPSSAGQTTSSSSPAFVHNGGVGSNHRKIAERDSLESSGGSGGSSSKRGERRKPSAGRIVSGVGFQCAFRGRRGGWRVHACLGAIRELGAGSESRNVRGCRVVCPSVCVGRAAYTTDAASPSPDRWNRK